jgi:hypothetical protein
VLCLVYDQLAQFPLNSRLFYLGLSQTQPNADFFNNIRRKLPFAAVRRSGWLRSCSHPLAAALSDIETHRASFRLDGVANIAAVDPSAASRLHGSGDYNFVLGRRHRAVCTRFRRLAASLLCHHIVWMARTHPHAEATYRVITLPGGTFGVKVSIPDTFPTTVSAFATKADAWAWIAKHKSRVKAHGSATVWFRAPRTRTTSAGS